MFQVDLLEERYNLAGKFLCSPKPLAEQHDFSDELSIRSGHRERTEEFLQVVGKVGAARVSRVHCDEDCHILAHADLLADQLDGY